MKSTLKRFRHDLQNFLSRTNKVALPVLTNAGNRIQFSDVQRRINIYLRALWDYDFPIGQTKTDFENISSHKPFIENDFVHLPKSYCDLIRDDGTRISAQEVYRAASAHAAAHLIYSKHCFVAESANKWERAVISTIEDARVEALAIRRFPGLKNLWAKQHTATSAHNMSASDYLCRLARALLDETYLDDDPWVNEGRELFKAANNLDDHRVSSDIGMTLAHAFQKKKIKFNARLDRLSAPYRDDNRYIWRVIKLQKDEKAVAALNYKSIVGISEVTVVEVDAVQTGGRTSYESDSSALASETYYYSEWDYRSQIDTQAWVTLREKTPKSGDLQLVEKIIAQNNHLLSRMKNLLQAIRYEGVRRIRKLEEGDEIDINAAIRAQIDINLGVPPDSRIMMRSVRKNHDISVLVLLDLSRSTMKKVQGQEYTVLQLSQEVCVLFADAIASVGDPFAIHGFCSETRHRVEYYRFKDFDQPYDDIPKMKIAGMTGQRNTRMGAAIRHATYYLNAQKSSKKLLMLITDGEPSDDDVNERKYLRVDTSKAVKDARRSGINTYCISLDPGADQYVSKIFGARNYLVVDHVKSLPEKILLLYASLTH
jgi:nitric oxide reductase NorD protein